MKNKFKVGDRVKCSERAGYSFVPCEGTIVRIGHTGKVCYVNVDNYENVPGGWSIRTEHLTKVTNNSMKIVITSDGKTTLARLYDGNKVVQRAEAVCSKDDPFNFFVGAKLAMERLMCNDEKKPTYFSGKAVCVARAAGFAYTVGKIYEFKDGRVKIDNGNKMPVAGEPVKTLEEFNNSIWASAKFIKLVE